MKYRSRKFYKECRTLEFCSTLFSPYPNKLVRTQARRFVKNFHGKVEILEACPHGSSKLPGSTTFKLEEENFVWQKEALVNIFLQRTNADIICWLDADLIFDNPNLEESILEVFNSSDRPCVAQLFSKVCVGGSWGKPYLSGGTWHGLAWAARTDFLRELGGLYYAHIFGQNDVIWADACMRRVPTQIEPTSKYPEPFKKHINRWYDKFKSLYGGFGVVPGTIFHLFHGRNNTKSYMYGFESMKRHSFDPEQYVGIAPNGLSACIHPQQLEDCKKFFIGRSVDADFRE